MLTTSDLQAIKKLVQDEGKDIRKDIGATLDKELGLVKSDLDKELGKMRTYIQEEGQVIRKYVSADVDKKLKPLKNDISKIKKDIDIIVRHFDREDTDLRRRMTRVEKHLSLPPMD